MSSLLGGEIRNRVACELDSCRTEGKKRFTWTVSGFVKELK